jgi:hypothetical protein
VGTCEPPPAITTSFITIENRVGSRWPAHLEVISFNGKKIWERPPSQEPHDGAAHLRAQQVTKFHLHGSLLHLTQTEHWWN